MGSLDGYTVGGRGTAWLQDRLRVGFSAQRDTVEEAGQTIVGGDLLLRLAAGTYAKAEVARSEGLGFAESYSVDGGLTSTSILNPGLGRTAYAWRAEVAADIAELTGRSGNRGNLSAFYERHDAGFSGAGRINIAGSERWGAKGSLPLGASGNIAASFEQLEAEVGRSTTGTVDLAHQFGVVKAKAGLRYEDRAPFLLFNSFDSGERTDLGVELEYAPSKRYSAYGFAQLTLAHDDARRRNNRAGLGARAELTKRLSLRGEASAGDGGVGADVELGHRLGEGSEAYVGYRLLADRTDTGWNPQNLLDGNSDGALTVGARRRFSDALSVYGETRVGIGGEAPSLTRSFGLKFEPTAHFSVAGTLESGRIDDASTGPFRRTAGSLSIGYVTDAIRIGSAVEARRERGFGRNQTVWLLRNDAAYAVDPDWRALARFNMAVADQEGSSVRAAEYKEAMVGAAYRPVDNDRVNALFRVTYFEDLGPAGQITGSGTIESPKQVSTVVSLDANYDLTPKLTLGAKYGFRQGKVSLTRSSDTFVRSDAHLAVVRADYQVVKAWDVMVEGRALWVTAADDKRLGALGAVYRHLGNNVKLGVGYSWSDFSDDLTDQSYTSAGPFLNLLTKF